MEELEPKIIKNPDGTYAIQCVPLVDNLPEGVTIEDIVSGRVNLNDCLATSSMVEEVLKRNKMGGKK